MPHSPKTILITGAAHGIGFASALTLLSRGHRVIATDVREDLLAAFDPHRATYGDALHTFALDIADPAHAALVAAPDVDVFIANGAIGDSGPLAEMPEPRVRALFETNVFGTLRTVRAALGMMLPRGRGRVIVVTSVAGHIVVPHVAAYCMTKHALEAMVDGLRRETYGMGVEVVALAPSVIATGFNEKMNAGKWSWLTPSSRWQPHFDRMHWAEAHFWQQGAIGPERVAEVMVEAVESSAPRPRYFVPLRGRVLTWLAKIVSPSLVDSVLRKMMQ